MKVEKRICEQCGEKYSKPYGESKKRWESRKFCSQECSRLGQRRLGQFRKGHTSWNTGKKMSKEFRQSVSEGRTGIKDSDSARKNKSKALKRYWESPKSKTHKFWKGKDHPNWKGDKVSYRNCHAWVRRNFDKTGRCEFCNKETRTEWSNKDHKYRRVREDWQELCRSCHLKYDKGKDLPRCL